jgi:hypothetical protein
MSDRVEGLPPDLLHVTQAAKLLPGLRPGKCINAATLWRWTRTGRLPSWKIGGCVYVSRGDVLKMARPVALRGVVAPAVVRSEMHREAEEDLRRRGLM